MVMINKADNYIAERDYDSRRNDLRACGWQPGRADQPWWVARWGSQAPCTSLTTLTPCRCNARCDEAAARIGQIGPHRPHPRHLRAGGKGARHDHRAVEQLADLLNQRKERQRARMAPCRGTDGDDAIHPHCRRLFRMVPPDHVVEHRAAIALHRLHHIGHRPQRGDDQQHPMRQNPGKVCLQPGFAAVKHQVHPEYRAHRPGQPIVDFSQSSSAAGLGAFRVGKLPITPARQFSTTRSGTRSGASAQQWPERAGRATGIRVSPCQRSTAALSVRRAARCTNSRG